MTKKPIGIFNISDTPDPAANEDWIKTPENRASERALHEEIVRLHRLRVKQADDEANDLHSAA